MYRDPTFSASSIIRLFERNLERHEQLDVLRYFTQQQTLAALDLRALIERRLQDYLEDLAITAVTTLTGPWVALAYGEYERQQAAKALRIAIRILRLRLQLKGHSPIVKLLLGHRV